MNALRKIVRSMIRAHDEAIEHGVFTWLDFEEMSRSFEIAVKS
jgi:hypothetical protein